MMMIPHTDMHSPHTAEEGEAEFTTRTDLQVDEAAGSGDLLVLDGLLGANTTPHPPPRRSGRVRTVRWSVQLASPVPSPPPRKKQSQQLLLRVPKRPAEYPFTDPDVRDESGCPREALEMGEHVARMQKVLQANLLQLLTGDCKTPLQTLPAFGKKRGRPRGLAGANLMSELKGLGRQNEQAQERIWAAHAKLTTPAQPDTAMGGQGARRAKRPRPPRARPSVARASLEEMEEMMREQELQAASLDFERNGGDGAGSEFGSRLDLDVAAQTDCASDADAAVDNEQGEDADYCDALRDQLEGGEDDSDCDW